MSRFPPNLPSLRLRLHNLESRRSEAIAKIEEFDRFLDDASNKFKPPNRAQSQASDNPLTPDEQDFLDRRAALKNEVWHRMSQYRASFDPVDSFTLTALYCAEGLGWNVASQKASKDFKKLMVGYMDLEEAKNRANERADAFKPFGYSIHLDKCKSAKREQSAWKHHIYFAKQDIKEVLKLVERFAPEFEGEGDEGLRLRCMKLINAAGFRAQKETRILARMLRDHTGSLKDLASIVTVSMGKDWDALIKEVNELPTIAEPLGMWG